MVHIVFKDSKFNIVDLTTLISRQISYLLTGGSPSADSGSSEVEMLLLVATTLSPADAARFVADLRIKRCCGEALKERESQKSTNIGDLKFHLKLRKLKTYLFKDFLSFFSFQCSE